MKMLNFSTLRHYFWSIFSVLGIVLLWAGIWEGLGSLPFLESPLISLIVGLVILGSSGLIFKEFDPLEETEESLLNALYQVDRHPEKDQFEITYHDKLRHKHIKVNAKNMKHIEKSAFVVMKSDEKKEEFIPVHRVRTIHHGKKLFWHPAMSKKKKFRLFKKNETKEN